MRRYVKIEDIRELRSWKHHPSARLYMYMCMTCDWENGSWSGTRRRVSMELGLTDQEYRTALKNLMAEGLIEATPGALHGDAAAPTQEVTQKLTQKVTQKVTQVTVVIYKQLGGGASPNPQPNSQPKEQPKEQPQNNNNNNNKTYSLPLARACAASLIDEVAEYIHSNREDAQCAIRAFLDAMSKKGKVWNDEGDFRAHLMDWALKRWLQVESRLSAANKAQEREERHQRLTQVMNQTDEREKKERYLTEWITAIKTSQRARELVSDWIENGSMMRPETMKIVKKLTAEDTELKRELTKLWEEHGKKKSPCA